MKDDVVRSHDLVPPSHQLRVHLFHGRERAVGEFADPCVAEVLVRGDEVHLVEVKPRILAHTGLLR